MTIRSVFKSHLPSVNFFFANGQQAAFMLGRFETSNPDQIYQLDNEIRHGHPHIYVDPTDKEVDTEAPTPMELIRAEALAQARAELAAAGSMSMKVSTSDSGEFRNSVTNTSTIAEGAAASDSTNAGATLVPATVSGASLMKLSAAVSANKAAS